MDIQELSVRSGIGVRKLRYCLDHDLVPGLPIDLKENEVGRPRKFANDVGFAIVCAAVLQEQGLPHPKIRQFLRGMTTDIAKLIGILEQSLPAQGQLGDGENFRLVVEVGPESPDASRWFIPGNRAKLDQSYRPRISVTLDLAVIREQVFRDGIDR